VRDGNGKRGHILVADDEADFRMVCRLVLTRAGFKVSEAADGREALSMARESRPDVVLLDLMMPVMDGWDCLIKMKEDPHLQSVPVIVITAKAEREDRIRALQYAADYIIKPVDTDALVRTVRRVLGELAPGP
jgi:DNA-binding response OmpR family regulator